MRGRKPRIKMGTKRGKVQEITERCKAMSPRLIDELEKIATSGKLYRLPTKLHAIEVLLDRAWGKPKETVDTGVTIVWDIGVNGRKAIKVKPEPPKQLTGNQ